MNKNKIEFFITVIMAIVDNIKNISYLKKFKKKILGKHSYLSNKMKQLKFLELNKKIFFGKILNKSFKKIKIHFLNREKKLKINFVKNYDINRNFDYTLPGKKLLFGSLHPITKSIYKIEDFFSKIGFSIINGYEIEDEYHNFSCLNIPKDHPSRNKKDTFWLSDNILLRTQTSNMQVHIMKNKKFPIKIISSGKVYRNDNDIKHTPMFHQIEGLIVSKNISFANLKWIICKFLNFFFKKKISIRFRNSYFPFTVLSAEVDIKEQNGKWLEILGCGIVHPNVLDNMNIDYKKYSGCAFGIGIERLTMLYYETLDLRNFFENNLNFLKQF
ncbi:phenylalanine--tRNA ligase subunit alpha [Buchnera aphidicola (Ceratoglyphina bambusae)]|uniref:phenylalanine--tRNA ligase subunit alpha n=1 Tax=Buchnera aphidicola TaxID=9 RepID=UPI0031B862E0